MYRVLWPPWLLVCWRYIRGYNYFLERVATRNLGKLGPTSQLVRTWNMEKGVHHGDHGEENDLGKDFTIDNHFFLATC